MSIEKKKPSKKIDKISTPKLKPGESKTQYATVLLSNTFLKLVRELNALAQKTNQYPPTDPLFDRNFAAQINDVRQRLEKVIPVIHSFSDERWAFSIFQYVNEEINNSGLS